MSEQEKSSNGRQLPAIQDDEIAKIRAKGAAMVAYQREVASIAKQIEGMEWGTKLSPATRYALGQFARITGANIQLHIDVLGGKPYLNANFWSDRINSDPAFISFEQREISRATEQALRARADEMRGRAEELPADAVQRADMIGRAQDLEIEADEIWRIRRHYGIPDEAESAYETTIVRFINAAPIDAIRRGDVTDLDPWKTEVREANWAGGKKQDPVGNQHPDRTARTRSLRRCASRAFTAWLARYDEQVRKAEEAIEAEFEILDAEASDRRALSSGPQAASTSGEPAAAIASGAEDLPGTREPTPREESQTEGSGQEEWDRDQARRGLFATLRDAGIEGDTTRRAWAKENGLPESTKDWGRADYERAIETLIAPHRDRYRDGCDVLGLDTSDVAFEVLGKLPEYLSDYKRLNAKLDELASDQSELPVGKAS